MGLKITNAGDDRPVVWLYGTIGDDFGGITADQVRAALLEVPKNKNFDLRIYSDGGSFDEAMAIHALVSQRAKKVRGIVDGLAASAASLLLQATGDRVMAQHSRQMIHQVHGRMGGFVTADQFRQMADQMDATNAEIRRIYGKKWKGSEDDLAAALATDSWYSAEQATEVGLADRVGEAVALAARVNTDLFTYQNVPDDVLLASGPYVPEWKAAYAAKLEAALK